MNAYEKVMNHYGDMKQLEKSVEELRELADAIEAYLMNIKTRNYLMANKYVQDVFGERADVGNVLHYVDEVFDFDKEHIEFEMDRKMQRTLERIENENK